MKRFFIVLTILSVLTAAATAQTIDGFKTTFQNFAEDMASVLAVSSTTGNVWSHAYVGGFPHLGAGLAVGANLIPADSIEPLFSEAGESMPSELEKMGIPIPSAALTFKIGLPFLKMDVGIKGGLIPESVSEALSSNGVEASYQTLGVNLRYALLQDRGFVPAVSLGASWNYLKGSVQTSLGVGDTDYTYDIYTLTVTDPDMALEWEANTFDFTLQASKKLFILTPYAGVGLTLGKSTVRGGMAAETTVTDGNPVTTNDEEALEQAAGIEIDDQGFLVSAESTKPVFRIYGGTSINILIVKIDLMANYVPASKALGAQAMVRIQL